jgi:hypothetical protein
MLREGTSGSEAPRQLQEVPEHLHDGAQAVGSQRCGGQEAPHFIVPLAP